MYRDGQAVACMAVEGGHACVGGKKQCQVRAGTGECVVGGMACACGVMGSVEEGNVQAGVVPCVCIQRWAVYVVV